MLKNYLEAVFSWTSLGAEKGKCVFNLLNLFPTFLHNPTYGSSFALYRCISMSLTGGYLITDSAAYAHYVFNAFDQDHSGSISFEEFVMGLSLLARGSLHEKLQWAFNLYDINGNVFHKYGVIFSSFSLHQLERICSDTNNGISKSLIISNTLVHVVPSPRRNT